jgi:citrate lyase beta subunit
MDLEDGVALNRKEEARTSIVAALRKVDFGRTTRLVRINPVGSPFWAADLDSILEAHPDGIVLPKTESAEHIKVVSARLSSAEKTQSLEPDRIRLLAIIESARGVVFLREIAEADTRLAGLIFGAEDLAGDIGATRTSGGDEVLYARSAVVVHAKARRLAAIDTPFVDLNDLDGLRADAERALRLGYTGKLAIHPRQVEPIQQAFTPREEEIRRAKRLIAAHEAHQAAGAGVFAFDGRMVDMPMIRAAETVLARARAANVDLDAL